MRETVNESRRTVNAAEARCKSERKVDATRMVNPYLTTWTQLDRSMPKYNIQCVYSCFMRKARCFGHAQRTAHETQLRTRQVVKVRLRTLVAKVTSTRNDAYDRVASLQRTT